MTEDQIRKQYAEMRGRTREANKLERLKWATTVLENYKGPGGGGRYKGDREAKEARKLYLKAYCVLWGRDKKYKDNKSTEGKERHALKRTRPKGVKEFYLDMLTRKIVNCYYCQKPLRPWEREADHLIPISRGGLHDISNLVICCSPCNNEKGNKTPEEFIKDRVSR